MSLCGNNLLTATDFSSAKLAELAEKGCVHFTLLDASSINYQYNYLCLIKMLCYRGRGLAFCIVSLVRKYDWNFTKEDKCQFVLPDPLFVHQSGKSTTQDEQRIYLYGGEQLAYLTSIRDLFVWRHTIIREGSFFP